MTTELTTTLNRIRKHSPCESGWQKLLSHLGKTRADDEPLPYATILDSNGLDDALWCCQVEPQYDNLWRLYAVWCARQVQHLMTDERSLNALDVAERFAAGEASDEELAAARYRSRAATRAATREAAREAADAACWAAAAAAVVATWYALPAAREAASCSAITLGSARASQANAFRMLVTTGELPSAPSLAELNTLWNCCGTADEYGHHEGNIFEYARAVLARYTSTPRPRPADPHTGEHQCLT